MWPWGHLAVGYLSYTVGVRLFRTSHERLALLACLFGTQFPDLVDKPLTWIGVLAYGRSLAHSLVVLVPLCLLVLFVAHRRGTTQAGAAFVVGVLSHLVSDAWAALVVRDADQLSFLLWPFVPSPDRDDGGTAASHASRLVSEVEPKQSGTDGLLAVVQSDPVVQLFVFLVVVALWVAEGMPGWER